MTAEAWKEALVGSAWKREARNGVCASSGAPVGQPKAPSSLMPFGGERFECAQE
jgi:hypothetical protein